jgi:hypothetical protein
MGVWRQILPFPPYYYRGKKQQIPSPTVGMWGKSKSLIIKNKKRVFLVF